MRLVVDTNILISELLRKRGRDLISSNFLELCLAEKMIFLVVVVQFGQLKLCYSNSPDFIVL